MISLKTRKNLILNSDPLKLGKRFTSKLNIVRAITKVLSNGVNIISYDATGRLTKVHQSTQS